MKVMDTLGLFLLLKTYPGYPSPSLGILMIGGAALRAAAERLGTG
jgi:hypothetical protein